MSQNEQDHMANMMQDQVVMLEALHNIALSSEDAETVRIAVAALTNTGAGMAYLQANPIIL